MVYVISSGSWHGIGMGILFDCYTVLIRIYIVSIKYTDFGIFSRRGAQNQSFALLFYLGVQKSMFGGYQNN